MHMFIEEVSSAKSASSSYSRASDNSAAEADPNPWPISSKARILICEPLEQAQSLANLLRSCGYEPFLTPLTSALDSPFRHLLSNTDVVILDLTNRSHDVLAIITHLNSDIGICNVRPRLLCFSTKHRNPEFILKTEKCGVRYVRVEHFRMLVEAVELLVAETRELERAGPLLRIVHRFSQGTCAPGEEVFAVELCHQGKYVHVPLALTERLVVEVLARHQSISMDSLQIVSSVSGEWFFRHHAANSGHRQIKKLHRPTVKVSIDRIRNGFGLAFNRIGLRLNPCDVLRSCPAAGTNRILYRLQAHIEWNHPTVVR